MVNDSEGKLQKTSWLHCVVSLLLLRAHPILLKSLPSHGMEYIVVLLFELLRLLTTIGAIDAIDLMCTVHVFVVIVPITDFAAECIASVTCCYCSCVLVWHLVAYKSAMQLA